MCGIAGLVFRDLKRVPELPLLQAMAEPIASRGPDDLGYWINPGVGLAHRRLSIIDLSNAAAQPMVAASGRAVISYNGEIYNYRELRKDLVARGNVMRTNSDSEVLVEGHLEWGLDSLLQRIEGMFAFALYDSQARTLTLARDRFGKKPLYYHLGPTFLAFSSDIRSLLPVLPEASMDFESLDYYLTELSIPQPRSVYREIRQVPPGSAMVIRLEAWSARSSPFWARRYAPKTRASTTDTLAEVERLLTAAVLKRTVADVPIGAFLSGGVDSGLIVALLASNSGPIKTFTVGIDDSEQDEAELARMVAQRYGTEHTELRVRADALNVLDEVIGAFGEPFADTSAIPTFLVSREIKRHVTVALSGDGGDELFGYPGYALAYRAQLHEGRHPTALGRLGARVADKARRLLGFGGEYVGLLQSVARQAGAGHLYRTMGFPFDGKSQLYGDGPLRLHADFALKWLNDLWAESHQAELVDTLTEASFKSRLLNDYLVKVDRASMAHALEVRSPFLDPSLAERTLLIPNEEKFGPGEAKHLLKRLAAKYLPEETLLAPKRGFSLPIGDWLRSTLGEVLRDTLGAQRTRERGWFKWAFVEALIREHAEHRRDHTHRLWALLCLELWLHHTEQTHAHSKGAALVS